MAVPSWKVREENGCKVRRSSKKREIMNAQKQRRNWNKDSQKAEGCRKEF